MAESSFCGIAGEDETDIELPLVDRVKSGSPVGSTRKQPVRPWWKLAIEVMAIFTFAYLWQLIMVTPYVARDSVDSLGN
jgi:hypothetical protein